MTEARPRRSVLYMPGLNARAHAKGREIDCDAVVFDLEDSAPPECKAEAREQVVATLKEGGFGHRERVIRINPAGSEWFEDDLAAAVRSSPDAILVTKVSSPDAVIQADRHLRGHPSAADIKLWAMIETPLGILEVDNIAGVVRERGGRRLTGLVLGTNDLAKETHVRGGGDRLPMILWMSRAVLAARVAGLFLLDGVYNDFSDAEGLEAECVQGRDFGMDGKTLIHPSQVEIANRVFAPSAEEVEEARAIVAAFADPKNARSGVISFNGRMVERLHAESARRVLALDEAIAARG
jgi:citrate lyase subunit beta / citryl-CoA lyase